jgi:hypothetical protein
MVSKNTVVTLVMALVIIFTIAYIFTRDNKVASSVLLSFVILGEIILLGHITARAGKGVSHLAAAINTSSAKNHLLNNGMQGIDESDLDQIIAKAQAAKAAKAEEAARQKRIADASAPVVTPTAPVANPASS